MACGESEFEGRVLAHPGIRAASSSESVVLPLPVMPTTPMIFSDAMTAMMLGRRVVWLWLRRRRWSRWAAGEWRGCERAGESGEKGGGDAVGVKPGL